VVEDARILLPWLLLSGGLGAAFAAWVSTAKPPPPPELLEVPDRFVRVVFEPPPLATETREPSKPAVMVPSRVFRELISVDTFAPTAPRPRWAGLPGDPVEPVAWGALRSDGFVDTSVDAHSFLPLRVDPSSWVEARADLADGYRPSRCLSVPALVASVPDGPPMPADGRDVAVHTEVTPSPWTEGRHLLRVDVVARDVSRERLPTRLVVVVDLPPSWVGDGELIERIQAGLHHVVDRMRPDDSLALVSSTSTLLEPTEAVERSKLHEAIERIPVSAPSDPATSLRVARSLADEPWHWAGLQVPLMNPARTSRVVWIGRAETFTVEGDHRALAAEFSEEVPLTCLSLQGGRPGGVCRGSARLVAYAEEPLAGVLAGQLHPDHLVAFDTTVLVAFDPDVVRAFRKVGHHHRRRGAGTPAQVDVVAGSRFSALYEVQLIDGAASLGEVNVHHRHGDVSASIAHVRPLDASSPAMQATVRAVGLTMAHRGQLDSRPGLAERLRRTHVDPSWTADVLTVLTAEGPVRDPFHAGCRDE